MDDLFKLLKDPSAMDAAQLGLETDVYIDRILKLMQLIYYGNASGNPELAEKITKTYYPVIELLGEQMEQVVNEYQEKHGEI